MKLQYLEPKSIEEMLKDVSDVLSKLANENAKVIIKDMEVYFVIDNESYDIIKVHCDTNQTVNNVNDTISSNLDASLTEETVPRITSDELMKEVVKGNLDIENGKEIGGVPIPKTKPYIRPSLYL